MKEPTQEERASRFTWHIEDMQFEQPLSDATIVALLKEQGYEFLYGPQGWYLVKRGERGRNKGIPFGDFVAVRHFYSLSPEKRNEELRRRQDALYSALSIDSAVEDMV